MMNDHRHTGSTEQVTPFYPPLPISERWCSVEVHEECGACADHTLRTLPRQTDMPSADECSVQAQLDLLWRQREELLSINNKWAAQYKVMTQYYKEKVREQQPSAKPSQPTAPLNQAKWENGEEKNVHEEEDVTAKTSKEKVMSRTDAELLRMQNAHLTSRGQHQCEEIRRLNQALQEALEGRAVHGEPRDDPQDNVWKHQAEVYKEDFLKERKDRERLKDKLLEMEKKYRKTHSQLHTLRAKVTWTPVIAAPIAACHCTNQTHPPANNNYPPTTHPHTDQHQQHPQHLPQWSSS